VTVVIVGMLIGFIGHQFIEVPPYVALLGRTNQIEKRVNIIEDNITELKKDVDNIKKEFGK